MLGEPGYHQFSRCHEAAHHSTDFWPLILMDSLAPDMLKHLLTDLPVYQSKLSNDRNHRRDGIRHDASNFNPTMYGVYSCWFDSAMENMERGLDKAKFTKLVVAVLGEHLNDAKEVRMISTRLWNEILKEQDKTPPKRKSGKSNWAAWSEKKKQRDGEKAEQNGMPKPAAEVQSPQKSQVKNRMKHEAREAVESGMPKPAAEVQLKTNIKREAQEAGNSKSSCRSHIAAEEAPGGKGDQTWGCTKCTAIAAEASRNISAYKLHDELSSWTVGTSPWHWEWIGYRSGCARCIGQPFR